MAEQSFPFDSGPGANVDEGVWRTMASRWAGGDGLLAGLRSNEAAITAGGGPEVTRGPCPSGVLVDGFLYRDNAAMTKPVPPNTGSNPRRDSAILRLDLTGNAVTFEVKPGAPAASPSPPVLEQSRTGVYEIRLADWTMPPAGSAQQPYAIVDTRVWSGKRLGGRVRNNAAQTVGPARLVGVRNWETLSNVGQFARPENNAINVLFVTRPELAGLYAVGYRVQFNEQPGRALAQVVVNDGTREYRTPGYREDRLAGSHVLDLAAGDFLKLEVYAEDVSASCRLPAGGTELYAWRLTG